MFAKMEDGGSAPVLRPWSGDGSEPFSLGMNLLAPFSNRISGGGFVFDGIFHELPANLEGEPFPIHGDAFQKAWCVDDHGPAFARLSLTDAGLGPFRYSAEVSYALEDGRLHTALALANEGPTLPFGGGLHPWFPRRQDTELEFFARQVWLEDAQHLPVRKVPLEDVPAWDFTASRLLPEGWINNAFCDWSGNARIVQQGFGIEVDIVAHAPLDTAIVYSPGAHADFFCFEPVSHAVDALNQPGMPGLVTLAPGERVSFSVSIGWRNAPSPA